MNTTAEFEKNGAEKFEIPIRISSFIIATLILLILSPSTLGQAPDLEWEEAFGGTKNERGLALQETRDASFIVAGYTASKGAGDRDLLLIKTDSEGEMEWERTIGGTGDDEGWAVLETKDGGYLTAGVTESWGSGKKDLWLVKTYSDGYEWFVDETPYDDVEFGVERSDGVLVATTDSEAYGKMDLLTVVTHELGQIGRAHV